MGLFKPSAPKTPPLVPHAGSAGLGVKAAVGGRLAWNECNPAQPAGEDGQYGFAVALRCRSHRSSRLALFGRKDNRRGKVGARKLHDGARDVILIV
jgi:hypothetical protein